MNSTWTDKMVARTLDAAILKPELTTEEVSKIIHDLIPLEVKTVCVRSCDVPHAKQLLAGTQTELSCVVGFPHGCCPTSVKCAEAEWVLEEGADEIDMVANYGYIRSQRWEDVSTEISLIADICKRHHKLLKVIFETSMLNEVEVKRMVECCVEAGADFVKTSTGFNGEGAQPAMVQNMINWSQGRCQVKPSGGIRSRETAEMYLTMGATRLGVNYSSVEAILRGGPSHSNSQY